MQRYFYAFLLLANQLEKLHRPMDRLKRHNDSSVYPREQYLRMATSTNELVLNPGFVRSPEMAAANTGLHLQVIRLQRLTNLTGRTHNIQDPPDTRRPLIKPIPALAAITAWCHLPNHPRR